MKTQKFASLTALPSAFLQLASTKIDILEGGIISDSIDPLNIEVVTDGTGAQYLKFTPTLMNPTPDKTFWTGGPVFNLDGSIANPDIYAPPTSDRPGLKRLYQIVVKDSTGAIVATLDPIIPSFGDTIELKPSGTVPPTYPSQGWNNTDGIPLDPEWADRSALIVRVDSLPNEDYTADVKVDPDNRWGQQTTLTVPFSVSMGAVTSMSLKITGKH